MSSELSSQAAVQLFSFARATEDRRSLPGASR